MKRETILRRDLLKRLATVGGAAAAWALGGIVPESRAFAATPSQDSAARAVKIDAKANRLLQTVRGTREYRNFKSALTSPDPIDLWTDGDYQFVSFGIKTVEQMTKADRLPFQLYSALIFAAGSDGTIMEVFTLRPEADGSTSALSSLRGGTTQTVNHSPAVQAKLADARRQATGIRASAASLMADPSSSTAAVGTAATLAGEGCDCGLSRRYGCDYQVCGGGYVDDGCYWALSLACVPVAIPYLRIACLIAARAACYVLPYCYCGRWSCYSCVW